MIQVRSANRRTLLLPDSPKFLNKKMQKLILSSLRMMNVLLLNWGIMGIFFTNNANPGGYATMSKFDLTREIFNILAQVSR